MRIFNKSFAFRKLSDTVELSIQWPFDFFREYHLPLTYTVEDCLEWWVTKRQGDFISFEIKMKHMDMCNGRFKYHGKVRKRKKAGRKRAVREV